MEVFDGEVCMPPTWLNFKDLKKEYDVSVPARAAGYLSVLSFRSGPGEILEKMRELGSEAFAEYIEKMDAERRRLEEKLSGRAMQGKKKCVKTAKPQAANAESVDHADPVSEEYADNVGDVKKRMMSFRRSLMSSPSRNSPNNAARKMRMALRISWRG